MLSPQGLRINSREIADSDIGGILDLFARGYPYRAREYWVKAFDLLAKHPTPPGLPKYGYAMECDGAIVGVMLLIFTKLQTENGSVIRCAFGGWCVDPEFRSHAPLLALKALKHKEATYISVPGPEIRSIVEAQGFKQYCRGQFIGVPILTRGSIAQVRIVEAGTDPGAPFEPYERDLLLAHAGYGCLSLWCVTAERAHPFVFDPLNVRGFIPCARLIYCRSIDEVVRFARPLGWHLLRRGRPLMVLDANGPIPAMAGKYFDDSRPKYFKGPVPPRLGDMAYTHFAMFER